MVRITLLTWMLALSAFAAPGPDGKTMSVSHPAGMLVYSRDGHMSVQLMYPKSAGALSNEYVLNGYEASFGSYDVDEASHTITHHVQGSIKSTRADERWSVTWRRY